MSTTTLIADAVSLADKYDLDKERAYLTGTQALLRMTFAQARLDREQGIDTGGFVTGYRGSPLGGVDMAFERAVKEAATAGVHFVPGVNEDLAATAILGTQQINLLERANKQGVFAMWYGKGPGVDRSGDAFRHGNLAGSAAQGGVLLLAGDDHVCKSSTTSHQSEYALMDAMVPIVTPSSIADIIGYGMHGWAMSRYSGCWTSMKLVADVVDSSASVDFPLHYTPFVIPTDFEMPEGGLNIRWPDTPQQQERRLHNFKIPAALAFARANPLDRLTLGGKKGRLGIITTGKAYVDTRQALTNMGIDEAMAERIGLSVYKVGLVWPIEPEGISRFAGEFDEILIVEEKRSLIELQIKDMLYNMPADRRPRVFGKTGTNGAPLLPAHDDFDPEMIGRAIRERIDGWPEIAPIADQIEAATRKLAAFTPAPVERTPYFCSGCPHNSSTRVPDGSRAMAGIGCHWMSQAMDRNTATYTHMGGEGANWIGQAPFVPTKHIFQNMGDGTFFHSGLLAIRAALAAKVTMTYKILFNDAVAMTGGQNHDGSLTAQRITQIVRGEGVQRIVVVADDPDKYPDLKGFAEGVTVRHRDDLDEVQRELREVPGVTVLVYDQVCAAAKRRRKKGAAAPKPETRVLINELVCEGCGDCSVKSNCLSVTPVETEFGRKRRIDQSSCNTDLSCVKGFCPSFVTVTGGKLRKGKGGSGASFDFSKLPEPQQPSLAQPRNIMVTGVGGTGVVTIGAILAMAAHASGKGCSTLDMTGMAQKGGPVTTHLRIAATPEDLHATRIAPGAADLIIGCDNVTTVGKEASAVIAKDRTHIVLNVHQTITSKFIKDRNFDVPVEVLIKRLRTAAGSGHVDTVDASDITARLLGDTMGTNLFMVGFAFQQGLLPLDAGSIERAIELNGAAVAMNKQAFALGRLAAHDPAALQSMTQGAEAPPAVETLDGLIARRADFLRGYQNAAYADQYRGFLDRVRTAERGAMGSEGRLSAAVARNLSKLMAYKDEYEVGRLYSGAAFRKQLEDTFEPGGKISYNLAPPLLTKVDPVTGEPRKMRFGAWMKTGFTVLSKLRFLRGSFADPFGYSEERKMERQLIVDYRASIEAVIADLKPARFETAVALAEVPDEIRGYGPVKDRSLARALPRWRALEHQYRSDETVGVSGEALAPVELA
jgi:indolepyruvate ferredoxin oxidoreductase